MRQGFVKAAAVTPKIKVADTKYNTELILDMMKESTRQGAKIVVFPELCLTCLLYTSRAHETRV